MFFFLFFFLIPFLSLFSSSSLPNPKQLLFFASSLVPPPFAYSQAFSLLSLIMACFGVVLVLVPFSDLAVFLWCWRLYVSEGAKITVLIFTCEDFAFPIGEKFNFARVCLGIFFVLPLELFFGFVFQDEYLGHSWICSEMPSSYRYFIIADVECCLQNSAETHIKQHAMIKDILHLKSTFPD